MGNQHSDFKQSRSLPNSPHIKRLGSPYKGHGGGGGGGGGSAIPTPALGGRRPPTEHHGRGLRSSTPASSAPSAGSQLKSGASASSSRSTSPANGTGIPQPRSHGGRASLNEKHAKTSGTSSLARSSLRGPANQGSQHAGSNHSIASPYHTPTAAAPAKHKDSMLEKFKLFNHKEKEGRNKTTSSSGVSKRTSSSSGFSSAKSERSDSSTSLCSDAKPPPLPPHQSLPVSTSSSSSEPPSHADQHPQPAPAQSKPQGL